MITIVEYLVSTVSLVSNINASTIKEYPLVYSNLLETISKNKKITVIVNNPVLLQWLKNMASRYPQGTFVFETVDARGVLAQRWGVEIPDSVTNEEIIHAGLLSLDLRPQPGFTFEDTLLAHYYAPS